METRTLLVSRDAVGEKRYRSVICKDVFHKPYPLQIMITGNLPELYKGMWIKITTEKFEKGTGKLTHAFIEQYEVVMSNKTVAALGKASVDVDWYKKVLEIHAKIASDGFTWDVAKLKMSEIYNQLSFRSADKLHSELVGRPDDQTRIEALKQHTLELTRRSRRLECSVTEYLSCFSLAEQEGAYEQLMTTLKLLALNGGAYDLCNGKLRDRELFEKDKYVQETIRERLSSENRAEIMTAWEIGEYIKSLPATCTLTEEQKACLYCMKDNRPTIITGGAGVGKTTVILNLLDCFSYYYGEENVLLVAPTGKAARRLREKSGRPASTIHRALRKSLDNDYIFFNEDNQFNYRLVVVDESSMIDTCLMYDLLKAVNVNAKIIFVGDHNQLPPVGYGEPFFDFLKILPVYHLTINHRQAEGTAILENATNVLEDKPLTAGSGVSISHIRTHEELLQVLDGADAETQIITPFNELNAVINDLKKKTDFMFGKGDKVMTIRNTADYCNGDIGTLIDLTEDGYIISIDGNTVTVPPSKKRDMVLAYAITVHKMQGSEADHVIVLLPEDRYIDKRLLYTAVTRAKKRLDIYYYKKEIVNRPEEIPDDFIDAADLYADSITDSEQK